MATDGSRYDAVDDDNPSELVVSGLREVEQDGSRVDEEEDVDPDFISFVREYASLDRPVLEEGDGLTPTLSTSFQPLSHSNGSQLQAGDSVNSQTLHNPSEGTLQTRSTLQTGSSADSGRGSSVATQRTLTESTGSHRNNSSPGGVTDETDRKPNEDRLKTFQQTLSTTDKPNKPTSAETTPTNNSPPHTTSGSPGLRPGSNKPMPQHDFIQQDIPFKLDVKTVQTEAKVSNPRLRGSQSRKAQVTQIELKLRRFQLLLNEGRIDEAMKDFRDALKQPDQPEKLKHVHARVCGQLGKLLLGKDRPKEALEILTKGLELFETGEVQSDGKDDFNTIWSLHDDLATCYSRRGEKDKERDHYEQAILLLSTTDVPPMRYPHMMNNLGNCYKSLGLYDKALKSLEDARDIMTVLHIAEGGGGANEDLLKALSSLASLYMEMERFDQAEEEFKQIIKFTENSVGSMESALRMMDAKRNLHEIYIRKGRMDEAAKYQQDDLGTMNELISAMGDGNDGGGTEDTGGKDGNVNWVQALGHAKHVSSAQQCSANGDHTTAIQHYNEALDDLNKNGTLLLSTVQKDDLEASIYNNMGHSYQELEDFDSALAYITQALLVHEKRHGQNSNSSVASSHFNLGNLQLRMAKRANYVEAKNHFQSAIDQYEDLGAADESPNQYTGWLARAYKGLGFSATQIDEPNVAISAYQSAKKLLMKLGEDHLQELYAVLNNLGNAYESVLEYSLATKTLEQTLKLQQDMRAKHPEDPEMANDEADCLNNLGCVHRSRKLYEKAEGYFNRSFELRAKVCAEQDFIHGQDDITTPLVNLANMYMKNGEHTRALETLRKAQWYAQKYQQDTDLIRVQLSICYEELGEKQQAIDIMTNSQRTSNDPLAADDDLGIDSLDLGL